MRRLLSLLVLAAALGSASELRAQTTATQDVSVTIKVPITLQHLYPSVTEIQLHCMMYTDWSTILAGVPISPRINVTQIPKAADGSISLELTATGTVTVPVTSAGKPGGYRCLPYGCVDGSCRQLSPNSPEAAQQLTPTSATIAQGTFTW